MQSRRSDFCQAEFFPRMTVKVVQVDSHEQRIAPDQFLLPGKQCTALRKGDSGMAME